MTSEVRTMAIRPAFRALLTGLCLGVLLCTATNTFAATDRERRLAAASDYFDALPQCEQSIFINVLILEAIDRGATDQELLIVLPYWIQSELKGWTITERASTMRTLRKTSSTDDIYNYMWRMCK